MRNRLSFLPRMGAAGLLVLAVLASIQCQSEDDPIREFPVAERPVLDPAPGAYLAPLEVEMSSTTPDASIRYTTDGSDPTESSALYVQPIPVDSAATFTAKTFAPDHHPSSTTTGSYVITPCTLQLDSPNGGGSLTEGTETTITWTSAGCDVDVTIELLSEDAVCRTIADATENDGSFDWIVAPCAAATASTQADGYKIRIRIGDPPVQDDSDSGFTIAPAAPPCALEVIFPNGGESLPAGSEQTLAWTSSGVCAGTLALELLQADTLCALLTEATFDDGSFAWTAEPCGAAVEGYRLRVVDRVSGAADTSDAPFSIMPPETCAPSVLAPAGAEIFFEGAPVEIRWDAPAPCGDRVRLELVQGSAACRTIADDTENDGLFAWTAERCPQPGGELAVRVTDLASGNSDESGRFAVLSCALAVTAPEDGDRLVEGQPHTLMWTPSECDENVRIDLLRDGVACGELAAETENDGAYTWTAARCGADTSGYAVRVTGLTSDARGTSAGSFRIVPPVVPCVLGVLAPNGGEEWPEGESRTIAWSSVSACGPLVRIELLREGTPCATLAEETANDGTFEWTVQPCAAARAGGYAVRVVDLADGSSDTSDAAFTIVETLDCTLAVSAPNGGESWQEGTEHTIQWDVLAPCGPSVRIVLLREEIACDTLASSTPNDGSFPWTATPCAGASDGYRVRVEDLASGSLDDGDATFSIPPVVPCQPVVTSPTGREDWTIGAEETIAWTPADCDAFVQIELLQAGAVCATLAASTENDGSFPWTVEACGDAGTTYKVRVTGLTSGASDESDAFFSIHAPCALDVLSPDGGESWPAGSAQTIAWASTDCGASVRLELWRAGAACAVLAAVTDNDGTFAWTATACGGEETGYTVRVVDLDSGLSAESEGAFTIPACSLAVTEPNGGEELLEGAPGVITWTAASCGPLARIELLRDGAPCRILAASTENDGSFDWTPERCDALEEGYTVRVTDLDSGASDASDGPFRIAGCAITVTAPSGEVSWTEGSSAAITWNATAACGAFVAIELLCDGKLCSTIAAQTENDGAFDWAAAACCEEPCGHAIRIRDLLSGAAGESDGALCICPPCVLEVTSPNGAESWAEGTAQTIAWDIGGCGPTVRIALLRDGNECLTIAEKAPNTGSYPWIAENCAGVAGGYTIRVSDPCGAGDASDAAFEIPECVVTVLSPNGGETWDPGSARTLTWGTNAICGASVSIALVQNGAACATLAASTPNDGAFDWIAEPCGGVPGCGYKVRVTDLATGKLDDSNSGFCLCPPCEPVVTSPNGGESWREEEVRTVTWTPAGPCDEDVRLELLRGAIVCAVVTEATPNDGSYEWTVQRCSGQTASDYRLRVTGVSCLQADESDAPFTILPPPCVPDVTSPDGGERWPEGSAQTITWSFAGGCGTTVQIDLLRDGTPCAMLAASTPNDGSFPWTASRCAAEIDGYAVRVTDVSTGETTESAAPFSIPDCILDVTAPDGGEVWQEGAQQTITWTATDCGDAVSIELSRDGAFCSTVIASTPNDGSFLWTPQNCQNIADGYRIHVRDLATGEEDASDAAFSIPEPPCQVAVTSPNGGESWNEGSAHTITWTTSGSCGGDVMIQLLHAGVPCGTLTADTPNDGSFLWTAERCAEPFDGYTVRVTSLATGIFDDSNAPFSIPCPPCVPTVLSPNGGESWTEGSARTITWSPQACEDSVRIELLRNNALCAVLSSGTPDDGSFAWLAQGCDAAASGYRVRVTGLTCGQSDTSNQDFTIPIVPNLYYFPQGLRFCAGEQDVQIALQARNAEALLGYGVSLCFDAAVFECVELSIEGTRGAGADLFESSCGPGACLAAGVIVAPSCPPQIDPGSGAILIVTLNVKSGAPAGPTTLDLLNVPPAFNTMGTCGGAGIDPALLDGTVEICAVPARPAGGSESGR